MLLSVVFCFNGIADDEASVSRQENVISEPDGRWIINHPDSRKIYAVQCGLDVTLFTLKYFKIDYSLPRVSLGLPLTTEGISLADIQQVLQVYGLEAEAQKGATIKQIAARLDGKYIAIIPLGMGDGRNHYYLGMRDDKGSVQLVNVGKGVSPLIRPDSAEYNDRVAKRFVEAGSIVLFVRKPTRAADVISKTIKILPEQIELGEFMIGGPEAANDFSVSFELFNTSDRPILVSSVQASCGCTMPKWEGGFLKAGAKQTVDFTVIPGAWGRGEQKKLARVTFADGSSLDVTLHGTGQTPVERQRIELSQYSAILEITEDTPRPEFDVRLARLTSYVRPINEITVQSNVLWLMAELREPEKSENGESEKAELYAVILTNDLLLLLDNGDQRQRCFLDISGAEGMEPVTMSLELFERDFYHLSQYFVTVSSSLLEPIGIQVTSEDENNAINILDVSVDAPFLSVETDGKTEIKIGFKQDVEFVPGYYFATAKIENVRKRSSLAKMTVYVPSGDK
jgi:hypothetical protein